MSKRTNLAWWLLALTAVTAAAQQTNVTNNGDGVNGTVPVYSGASALANSPITVSGSNVGIGTTAPTAPVSINAKATNGAANIPIVGLNTADGSTIWYLGGGDTTYANFMIWAPDRGAGGYLTINKFSGNVGIGTATPGATLEVNGNVKLTSGSGGSITFQDGTTQTTAYTGTTCGGDYAESVDVSGNRKHFGPGDVLVIDPDHSGKFLKSAEPYSTSVTGIYSTKPGTVGRRQTGPKNPDEVPMAMIGIVPTKVSAENGPIHPGDLLVTSSTVGYAMKGTERGRMLGAVIGKALGNLDSGKGVIEVVVTLQ